MRTAPVTIPALAVLCVVFMQPTVAQNAVQSTSLKPHAGGAFSIVGPTWKAEYPPVDVAPSPKVPAGTSGVARRVPSQYATIQAAINACSNGDTVLVSEGTYKENIRYRGKAITVASLYLTDGDTSHISKTIIDGSGSTKPDSGSVVSFVDGEDTTSVLCGLTIQGGTGTRAYLNTVGGAWWSRTGGGVFCSGSGAGLKKNIITHNRIEAAIAQGGGIAAWGTATTIPYVILENNRISGNWVKSDTTAVWWGNSGGAHLVGVDVRVVGNTFQADTATGSLGGSGGGIGLYSFSSLIRLPVGNITGNVFRSNVAFSSGQGGVGAGLVVKSTGSITIQGNLFDGNTATCSQANPGVWSWAQGAALCVDDQQFPQQGRKMILNNRFINNKVDCSKYSNGGAIFLYLTTATVSGNYFSLNRMANFNNGGGGAFAGDSSSFRLENNIFADNSTASVGGAVWIWQSPYVGTEQTVVNNTITHNFATYGAAGLGVWSAPKLVSLNNIFWADSASSGEQEIYFGNPVAAFSYSDVKGGYSGTGNINADPLFVVGDTLFHLMSVSPCIGRGCDSAQIGGTWYRAPVSDYDGSLRPKPVGKHPDMGAQEEQITRVISSQELPRSYALDQNYPNPFNSTTTMRYDVPSVSTVTLKIFDLLGREVAVLVNERKNPGTYEVQFDGSRLSSGVYFYRIEAGSFAQTKKLVLLK